MSTLEERLRDKHDKQDGGHYCMARSEGDTCHIDQEWLLVFIKSEIAQAKHEAREEMMKMIDNWATEGCGHTNKEHNKPENDCPGFSLEDCHTRNIVLSQIRYKLSQSPVAPESPKETK